MVIFTMFLLVGIILQIGCTTDQTGSETTAFYYDQTALPGAKPWISEKFRNNPDNFQFAILGDRGGGASPLGTYERAIEQLNWLQPEFVMTIVDFVEGDTSEQEEMDEQ